MDPDANLTYNGVRLRAGDRVELLAWAPSEVVDDNESVPPGTQGTVTGWSGKTGSFGAQLWVEWDNGSRLMPNEPGDLVKRVDEAWRRE